MKRDERPGALRSNRSPQSHVLIVEMVYYGFHGLLGNASRRKMAVTLADFSAEDNSANSAEDKSRI